MTASASELRLQVFVSPAHPIGNDGKTGATLSDFADPASVVADQ